MPGQFSTVLSHARAAINMLVRHRVAPTPPRFTIAYLHQTAEMLELSMALNRLIGQDKVTAEALDELYDQFFGRIAEITDLRDASRRVERTVAAVEESLGSARHSAERYGQALSDFVVAADASPGGLEPSLESAVATVLDETRLMAATNQELDQRLAFSSREIALLHQQLDRLEDEGRLDALTGIANRRSFDASLRAAIVNAAAAEEPLTLLMIDIDHFSAFNTLHGHAMGDQVLRLVTQTMRKCTTDPDAVARYGGEEFCVMLRRSPLGQGLAVAESIRRFLAAKKVVNRRTGASLGRITLSIGAAQHRPGEPAAALVHRADEALYLAKTRGRNRVVAETELPEGHV
jgi:diguanylate cyclase